jgi:hypothetical protein
MNREILFRGKPGRHDTPFVYGDLVHNPDEGVYIKVYAPEPGRASPFYRVYSETVGQFTGLTDKNGKRIFEGDVVRYTNKDGSRAFYEVLWSKKHGAWMLRYSGSNSECFSVAGFHLMVEVIGNIHDNPELLEVAE